MQKSDNAVGIRDNKKAALLIECKACHQEACPSVCRFRLIFKLISLCRYKELVHRFIFPDRRLLTTLDCNTVA